MLLANSHLSTAVAATLCVAPSVTAATFSHKLVTPESSSLALAGISVALDGRSVFVGSPLAEYQNSFATTPGVVHAYDALSGALGSSFTPPDVGSVDEFGTSVAAYGGQLLVGSPEDDDRGQNSGSAYLLNTDDGSVTFQLTAPDGSADDGFGNSVSFDGTYALVGSRFDDDRGAESGSAYLFNAATGSLRGKLTAPDGSSGDQFGESVAIDGNLALIGSRYDDGAGASAGSAYVFDTATGALLHKLTAPDAGAGDQFGLSVALNGDLALVGSSGNDGLVSDAGAAYLFNARTGSLLSKLTAPDGSSGDAFGISVALSASYALVGAFLDDEKGNASGSAYLFDTQTGHLLQKLTAPDGDEGDWFGVSVAVSDNTALVGAMLDDDLGLFAGSAYLFTLKDPQGDANNDGVVNLLDFDILATNFGSTTSAGPSGADFNNDGVVNLLDFDILATNFSLGGSAAVPEPASLALMGLGMGAASLRRASKHRRRA